MKKNILIPVITILVIILDVITKVIIVNKVAPHDIIRVLPFMNIVHIENKGAAFGLFADLGNVFFVIISVIAILFILYYLKSVQRKTEITALSLVLGGAIGNLIDRIRIGKVTDFIDIYVNTWHWPSFNIADSALTVGIILFLWANVFGSGHIKNT
ncbi:MAG: signal peptidase II [Nitrospiraceae bacterium]|nr:MAG: signal peptidase II [Nitrospiraceae bacterium]